MDTISVRPPSLLRRCFQFRLRTLLLAVVVLSLALGWYVRRVEIQRQAVTVVKNAGGDIFYDFEISAGKLDFKESPIPGPLLDRLGVDFFHAVERVDLGPIILSLDGQCVDATIARLPDFLRVQHLVLDDASDVRLNAVGKLTLLERLAVVDKHGRVTNDGIAELRHLPRLKSLWIEGVAGLNDESLRTISALEGLELLSVGHARPGSVPPEFTDSGLAHLARLKHLTQLYVEGCDEGQFARLKKALPNCKVNAGAYWTQEGSELHFTSRLALRDLL